MRYRSILLAILFIILAVFVVSAQGCNLINDIVLFSTISEEESLSQESQQLNVDTTEENSEQEQSKLESSEAEETELEGSESEESEPESLETEESEPENSETEECESESSETEESESESSESEESEFESSESEESEFESSETEESEFESSETEESEFESSETEESEPESSEPDESEDNTSSEEVIEPIEIELSIPQGLRVSYIVYDVESDTIISSLNTNEDYRTGCTIKTAYVLWLLKNNPDLANEWNTKKLTYYKTKEGTSVWRDMGVKDGTKFKLSQVLEYSIKYSDNDAYIMLTTEYEYEGFNSYMEELGTSIRLGSYETGYNFTSATAEEQFVIWKEIMKFCFEEDSVESQAFKSWLIDAYYDFIERTIKEQGLHMSGWSPDTGTINDCVIILDQETGKPKTIFILLTSDGVKVKEMKLGSFYNIVSQIWNQIK